MSIAAVEAIESRIEQITSLTYVPATTASQAATTSDSAASADTSFSQLMSAFTGQATQGTGSAVSAAAELFELVTGKQNEAVVADSGESTDAGTSTALAQAAASAQSSETSGSRYEQNLAASAVEKNISYSTSAKDVPSSATGSSVVNEAKKYLGVPYVWGGTSNNGLDCSGLVQKVFGNLGVDLPRVARDQAKVGTEVANLKDAQAGDIIGMRNGKHIAIYLGENKILHAPRPGSEVSIRSLTSADDIDTIRRVTRSSDSATNAAAIARLNA